MISKMTCSFCGFMLLMLMSLIGCRPAAYLQFDHDVPGMQPKVFAKDLISKNNEHVGYCALNNAGDEFYYAITDSNWATSKIIKVTSSNIAQKDTLYLKDKNYEGEPFLTKDGQTMYFTVVLPPPNGKQWQSDIYRVYKTSNGWSAPEQLDSTINSSASEWHVSMTDHNIMYFTSEREKGTSALFGDIYRIEVIGKQFHNLAKLSYPVNTEYNDSDPLIAPDESFLIFHSDRPGGFGDHDLYISFNDNGEWSEPVNMGKDINGKGWEMAPSLTPDGKYLLFTRRKALITSEPAQIYWVSTRILKRYKHNIKKQNSVHKTTYTLQKG